MVNRPDQLVIRPFRPEDEPRILETFNLVFREVCGPEFVDRTPEFWRWQYRDNPAGSRIWVAAAPDGTIASHYAGVPSLVDSDYGQRNFVHCVDSFSHPEWRAGLKRPGVFVLTAKPYTVHTRAMGDAVNYGYPVPMAERIGRRFLEYHFLRTVNFLCLPIDGGAPLPQAPSSVEVETWSPMSGGPDEPGLFGEHAREIDALYARFQLSKHCCIRRDTRYLDWRFVRVPDGPQNFVFIAARRAGTLAGLAVVRTDHELVEGACTIADWIVPEADTETADALLSAIAARAQKHDRRQVMAVFADTSAEAAWCSSRGFEIVPSSQTLERRLIYLVTAGPMTGEWLGQHWWYTLGDSDLV